MNQSDVFTLLEKAYKKGFIDACAAYAVWKDGRQLVGVQQTDLQVVINELETNPCFDCAAAERFLIVWNQSHTSKGGQNGIC